MTDLSEMHSIEIRCRKTQLDKCNWLGGQAVNLGGLRLIGVLVLYTAVEIYS